MSNENVQPQEQSLPTLGELASRSGDTTTTYQIGNENPQIESPPEQAPPEDTTTAPLETQLQEKLRADDEVADLLKSKGVDVSTFVQEYAQTQALSPASYDALAKVGFSASVVDSYIAGQQALAERFTDAVYKLAGGQKEYEALVPFIASLGKAHVDSYNNLIETGNLTQLEVALNGYKSQMASLYGTANKNYLGGATSQGTAGFSSKAAMTAAINDPRYRKDAVYTRDTISKIMKTNF